MKKTERLQKELPYKEANENLLSVCSGKCMNAKTRVYEECKKCNECYKFKRYPLRKKNTRIVNFHYIESFRECNLNKNIITSEELTKNAIYNILITNDLACASIVEIKSIIPDNKEIKKVYGALDRRRSEYEYFIRSIMKKKQELFSDFCGLFDDFLNPKLDVFKESLKKAIEKVDVEDSELLAKVEFMRTMVGYSVFNVKNRINECIKYEPDIIKLKKYQLLDMKRVAENFSDIIWKNKSKGLDLNKCNDVMNAYREVDKVLRNKFIINECLEEAACVPELKK